MKKNIAICILFISIAVFSITLKTLYTFTKENKEVAISDISLGDRAITKSEATLEDHPLQLEIPVLALKAKIVPVGVTEKGAMVAPKGLIDVGWYKYGAMPGFNGSAVIAGHVDNAFAKNGVFRNLNTLQKGSEIFVYTKGGERLRFLVTDFQTYDYDKAPTEAIFDKNGVSRLNLITCSGKWNSSLKTYDKRLVVFATLASN